MNVSNSASDAAVDRLLIEINTIFAIIGCLAAISNLLLIAITRACRQFIHRLQLYLTIICLVFSATLGFETLPVIVEDPAGNGSDTDMREGWGSRACVAIGYVAQHFAYSTSFCVVWICVYVFSLAFFQAQRLKRVPCELLGLAIVFLLPAALAWVPFLFGSYGLDGIWCWIRASTSGSEGIANAFAFQGIEMLLHLLSIVLICAVVFKLCRRWAVFGGERRLQSPYGAAIMEVTPLVIYPSIYSVANLVGAVKVVYDVVTKEGKPEGSHIDEMVVVCLLQTFLLALPISFLLHPSIRREIGRLYSSRCGSGVTSSFAGLWAWRSSPYTPLTSTTESERTLASEHAPVAIQCHEDEEDPLLFTPLMYSSYGTKE